MTFKEFAYLANLIRTTYPREKIFPNNESMEIWFEMLQDIPFQAASAGLKKWIATEKWSPSIADIREMAVSVTSLPTPDWGQGWQEVIKAIGRYGYMRESEALASMSPQTAEAVKRIGWQAICESENPETLRAQFRQVYEISEKREKQDAQLPQSLKNVIAQFQIGSQQELTQLGDGNGI